MTVTTAHADRYLAAWNETDPAARRAIVAEVFSADVRYTDPLADVRGTEALAATIGAVQQQFPGFVFRLLGPVDPHHDQLRFTWELGPEGAEAPVVGSDVAVLDAEGRISAVLGFLDRVPAAA
ncbi:nuclear transport factor 2 family protein [Blastococcus sp. TML/M2B]|nr:nuclear transport factor 2 family protein [Blastococcus sp. TML/M2B]MBN1095357.1 nuclear transport factor 2 family protein [Blastococcus sp. TML/C7B]